MDGKAVSILESFPTIPTSIGLLPCVFSFMSPAFTVMTKGFPTLLTLVRLLFSVDSSVLRELCLAVGPKDFSLCVLLKDTILRFTFRSMIEFELMLV